MDTTAARSAILTQRYRELQDWLAQAAMGASWTLAPLAGDASFRRYYRAHIDKISYVLMDAPPDREGCHPFVSIAETFKAQGIGVPVVHAKDLERGFLLLSDLGDRLYSQELTKDSAGELYGRAFDTLLRIAACPRIEGYLLPQYGADLLQAEMNLFSEWYLAKYKNQDVNKRERDVLLPLFSCLIDNALQQPQVCVHRDYHSRNLLVCDDAVGVLDFQDAVYGPITYDLVSLLKDCYIAWPLSYVTQWVENYYQRLQHQGFLQDCSLLQFTRWFDLMGLQRHLKCLGIFSRLHFRDQKSAYLADIPRVLAYVKNVCQQYPEFSSLLSLL
jgi:N-acetylmuramate 1-kinase